MVTHGGMLGSMPSSARCASPLRVLPSPRSRDRTRYAVRGRGPRPPSHRCVRPWEGRRAGKGMIAVARWRGSSWPRRGCPCDAPGLPGCWRCSCSNFQWIEPRHRLQVTSCHPRTTRGRRRPWLRRWPQAVCSRSVSHRWMGCGTADLPRRYQDLTSAGISQTCPEPCCRGLGPGGALRRVQRGRGAQRDRRTLRCTSPSRR
jgi:hypothetical protein